MKEYNPRSVTKALLDRAYEFIESVPYRVSGRWLFYRLLQEGYIKDKKDDRPFWSAIIEARKRFYKDWRPNTLDDDTRRMIERIGGRVSIEDCVDSIPRKAFSVCHWAFKLDHFYCQENFIELWFEAQAMVGQFEYHTENMNLVPFRGDASIALKWNLAKHLEEMAEKYGKPIFALYFGDADKKGLQIPKSAVNDVRKWCGIDFELVRCGLTREQAEKYKLPENPDRPGQYQWEALSDKKAGKIISKAVGKYIDQSIIDDLGHQKDEAMEKWEGLVENVLKRLVKREKKKEETTDE